MQAVSISRRIGTQTTKLTAAQQALTLTMLLAAIGCGMEHNVPTDPPETTLQKPAGVPQTQMTRDLLDESLQLGRRFLLARQTPDGDFRYQVNFLNREESQDPAQVRKAGALWGVALIHHEQPSKQTRESLLKGFAFYRTCSHPSEDGGKFIAHPGVLHGETGTMALVSLALIEFLRTEQVAECRQQLDDYLTFLLTLRTDTGQFRKDYELDTGFSFSEPMPYFDGESLLAITKAARYLQRDDLRTTAIKSAHRMFEMYGRRAREAEKDSPATKAFYQWGSMAFFELYSSGWDNTEMFATHTIDLAHWMIDVHRTEERKLNTGYALEGISCAYELARLTQQATAQQKFAAVIERQLYKLTGWQLTSPVPCSYLQAHSSAVATFAGGVMNACDDPELRIDVTQHQMHAVILARRYLWPR
ncbi:MAG: hypothetical protein VX346_15315 [Planctomycetota bacterium]|nr:hypothetical protein [Planctomycetota bacterium]